MKRGMVVAAAHGNFLKQLENGLVERSVCLKQSSFLCWTQQLEM